jgi:serine/threonine-protein kinase
MQPSFGAAPTPYPQPGEVLDGKYRIEQMLGEGGMGAVAKATHVLRRAPVALKFMSPAVLSMQGAVERFVNEGVAASQIDSDHVVKVFDVGRLPSGAPYLVMEFLEGRDLSQLLEREGPVLPVPRAVHFTVQALRALHTAHAAGIVHRDMKPSNCFVINKDGEPDFVKLVDFGISKVRSADEGGAAPAPHLTKTNSALGTPLYMSPEQARSPRDVDHRSDLYSVGAILYEMLAGRTPYTSDTGEFTEILFKIFTTEPEPLQGIRPDLPEGLAAVVHRALLRDREGRFASAADMAEALAPYADERSREQFSRLRSTRRSMMPPGAPGLAVTPLDASVRATQSEATARTYASSLTPPAPPVPTAGGVAREASGPARAKSRAGLVGGVVAGVVALGVAGVFAMRSHEAPGPPPRIGSEQAASTQSAPPTPATAAPPPAPIETAVLAPTATPSEAPKPSATPAHPAPTAPRTTAATTAPSAHPATPGAPLPTQLGDLKLH